MRLKRLISQKERHPQRHPINDAVFIEKFGRILNDAEKTIAVEMRRIISEAAEIDVDTVYPDDRILELFQPWSLKFLKFLKRVTRLRWLWQWERV